MCCNNLFTTPDIPDPPPPAAQMPDIDPEEAARRRRDAELKRTGREQLIVNQGVANTGKTGTGLRIGG